MPEGIEIMMAEVLTLRSICTLGKDLTKSCMILALIAACAMSACVPVIHNSSNYHYCTDQSTKVQGNIQCSFLGSKLVVLETSAEFDFWAERLDNVRASTAWVGAAWNSTYNAFVWDNTSNSVPDRFFPKGTAPAHTADCVSFQKTTLLLGLFSGAFKLDVDDCRAFKSYICKENPPATTVATTVTTMTPETTTVADTRTTAATTTAVDNTTSLPFANNSETTALPATSDLTTTTTETATAEATTAIAASDTTTVEFLTSTTVLTTEAVTTTSTTATVSELSSPEETNSTTVVPDRITTDETTQSEKDPTIVTPDRVTTDETTQSAISSTSTAFSSTDLLPSTSTVLAFNTSVLCVCGYRIDIPRGKEEIEEFVEEQKKKIQTELNVDKETLSSTVRKKISYEDKRPSVNFVGYAGVAFICSILGSILLLDLTRSSTLLEKIKLLYKNSGSKVTDGVP